MRFSCLAWSQARTDIVARPNRFKENIMKTRTATAIAALISTFALGLATNVHARGDNDGWRDGQRSEYRWNKSHDNRWHDRWERHHRQPHRHYSAVTFYGPTVYHPAPVYYTTRTYRYDNSPSVIIDLPTIVFR
jgi:hypothetical protein